MKGVDARCLANLIWALAKLDLSNDEHGLTTDLALTVAPFIIRTIHSSSPQGLANMLWSYAKLPVSPPEVIAALMNQITEELVQSIRSEGHKPFDAQVCYNREGAQTYGVVGCSVRGCYARTWFLMSTS